MVMLINRHQIKHHSCPVFKNKIVFILLNLYAKILVQSDDSEKDK